MGKWSAIANLFSGQVKDADRLAYMNNDIGGGTKRTDYIDGSWTKAQWGTVRKTNITSAQILALNTTPIAITETPPAGHFIQVTSVSVRINNSTIAYATNTEVAVQVQGAVKNIRQQSNFLSQGTDTWSELRESPAAGDDISVGNPYIIYVPVGDPTAGDGDIDVFVTYNVIPE